MNKAAYYQRGETLDYTNSGTTTIEAGTVLTIGKKIGVAATRIKAGQLGTVDVIGVFYIPKTSTNAIAMGVPVYFDGSGITDVADNGLTGDAKVTYTPAGYAAADAGADDTEVLVKINA